MSLNKAWSSKKIVSYFYNNRSTFNSLYKGEKYLITKYVKKNDTILDIGCAQGGLFKILKKKFSNIDYTGLDFNKEMINLAKKKIDKKKFFLFKGKNYYSFFKKRFDVVIIFGILHLNTNWKSILINAYKVAKKKVLFDLRFASNQNSNLQNYLSLNFDNRSKKFLIPYLLVKKKETLKFFKDKFRNSTIDNYSYTGKPSKYSSIQSKIVFANFCLKKND
jgi:ubiquinone/menaquinone biosynthesis C-methylase UbiE